MWKLELPSREEAINEIGKAFTYVKGKPKYTITKEQEYKIEEIYNEYDSNLGERSNILLGNNLSEEFLAALENSYSEIQEKGRLKDLREQLLLNAKTCPVCGILVPDELDHHLPRSIYKTLSLYSRNLVPYCHKCNNKKRAVDGSNPDERFIHPYFSKVPEQEFLIAKVEIINDGLKIDLEIQKGSEISEDLYCKMKFQMERVNLKERLMRDLNLHLTSLYDYIESDYKRGGSGAVKEGLLKNADGQALRHGLNHWRSAVIKALANHEEFCDGGFYRTLGIQ